MLTNETYRNFTNFPIKTLERIDVLGRELFCLKNKRPIRLLTLCRICVVLVFPPYMRLFAGLLTDTKRNPLIGKELTVNA
jgi:hypothetical protein